MKQLHFTGQFKKDYKRIKNNPSKVEAFKRILDYLIQGNPIPQVHKPHPLKGNYKGCMECHIGDDFLLIWIDGDIVELIRIGSHSELFG